MWIMKFWEKLKLCDSFAKQCFLILKLSSKQVLEVFLSIFFALIFNFPFSYFIQFSLILAHVKLTWLIELYGGKKCNILNSCIQFLYSILIFCTLYYIIFGTMVFECLLWERNPCDDERKEGVNFTKVFCAAFTRTGVNFFNVLRTAFTHLDPECAKKTVKSVLPFYAFWLHEHKSCT